MDLDSAQTRQTELDFGEETSAASERLMQARCVM